MALVAGPGEARTDLYALPIQQRKHGGCAPNIMYLDCTLFCFPFGSKQVSTRVSMEMPSACFLISLDRLPFSQRTATGIMVESLQKGRTTERDFFTMLVAHWIYKKERQCRNGVPNIDAILLG